MTPVRLTESQIARRARGAPLLAIVVSLAVLGAAIYLGRESLQKQLQQQLPGRDAEILHAVAASQLSQDDADELVVVLEAAGLRNMRGVLGVRFFDAAGAYQGAGGLTASEADLAPGDLVQLKQLKSVHRFYAAARLEDFMIISDLAAPGVAERLPLLEIIIPLHAGNEATPRGFAQFLINGESIAAEFAQLDRNLTAQAWTTFAAGGAILALVLGWTFHRLQRTHQLLAERTRHLLDANQQLALAARTNAVGAVAAHLIHGLKNPMSGLQTFVAGLKDPGETEWFDAVSTTRRMQNLINDVVNVLREDQAEVHYELSVTEIFGLLQKRISSAAEVAGVKLRWAAQAEGMCSNRVANLVLLILGNLLQNAIEATPAGKSVLIRAERHERALRFTVEDEGLGLSPALQKGLFSPCASTKEGGSGIGLAISKQLANHLGAQLELKCSSEAGSTFELVLPDFFQV